MRLIPVLSLLAFALSGCISFSSSDPPPPASNTIIYVPPGSTITR
jgi:hypothetical protein